MALATVEKKVSNFSSLPLELRKSINEFIFGDKKTVKNMILKNLVKNILKSRVDKIKNDRLNRVDNSLIELKEMYDLDEENECRRGEIIYCALDVGNDGYDRYGPESYLYDYLIIWDDGKDLWYHNWHSEYWPKHGDRERDIFSLFESKKISNIKDLIKIIFKIKHFWSQTDFEKMLSRYNLITDYIELSCLSEINNKLIGYVMINERKYYISLEKLLEIKDGEIKSESNISDIMKLVDFLES